MKNLSSDMQAFHLELVTLVDQTFKESLERYTKECEAEPLDGEDRIRSYVCTAVEEAIRVQLNEKYQKRAIEFQKSKIKKFLEQQRNDLD